MIARNNRQLGQEESVDVYGMHFHIILFGIYFDCTAGDIHMYRYDDQDIDGVYSPRHSGWIIKGVAAAFRHKLRSIHRRHILHSIREVRGQRILLYDLAGDMGDLDPEIYKEAS